MHGAGRTARPLVQVRSPGCVTAGGRAGGGSRGNGGAGSGPRRCAVALEAAGQAAPPAMARLPAPPAAYDAVPPIVQRILHVLAAPCCTSPARAA